MSNVLKNELNVTYEKRTKNIEGETVNVCNKSNLCTGIKEKA